MTKKETASDIKRYKELVKGGRSEYLLTQGGKMGLLFGTFIFLLDYLIWQDVKSAEFYLFSMIFFGLFMGLWSWHIMNKRIKEGGKKR